MNDVNNKPKPIVDWSELQKRKLQIMSETVPHFKEVAGLKILIHPNVYPPGTDTALLANTVHIKKGQVGLDLCTGTGVIACKLAAMGAKSVLGIDLNPRAILNAKENKKLLKLNNLSFKRGNMFGGITDKFDVISMNPPYTDRPATNDIDICFFDEDHRFIRNFFSKLAEHLRPNGTAYIAWSNISSLELLPSLAQKHKFQLHQLSEDTGGRGYKFYVYSLKKLNDD